MPLARFGGITAPYTQRTRAHFPRTSTHSHPPTMIHIHLPPFLPKGEFWSPLRTSLKRCIHHRTIQTQFFISHNPSLDFHNVLSPQPGYHDAHPSLASDTIPQPLPFEVAPTATFPVMDPLASRSALPTDGWAISHHDPSRIATSSTTIPAPPPNVPYSDHITTVNAVEAYGVPVGAASSINQTIAVDSVPNPSNPPVMIDQKSWYSEYGVDRGANGLFHCPFPGCAKENKRRDQLWEHWKAKHNNDPYRCGRWSVLQYSQSLIKHALIPNSATKLGYTMVKMLMHAVRR